MNRPARQSEGKAASRVVGRWQRGTPVLRYTAVFGALVVLFYVGMATYPVRAKLFPGYLRLNARIAASVVSACGEPAQAQNQTVRVHDFAIEVREGCDALEPSALFVLAVVASPVTFWLKMPGLLFGTLVLGLLNVARLVSLVFVGRHWPRAFEIFHLEIWQPVFILLSIVLWMLWGLWARRETHDPSATFRILIRRAVRR